MKRQDEKARQGYQIILNTSFANALASNSVNAATASPDTGCKKPTMNVNGFVRPFLKCVFHNFDGHTKKKCYKLIGYL